MSRLKIPFVLIDESVVDYGFRVLMSGFVPEPFEQNPVMLLQHKRPDEFGSGMAGDDVVLPLGKWYDTKVEAHQLISFPEFDDDDKLAKRVQGKVEKGYLNAASIWIDPIEVSDDENLKIPGQCGLTITKWTIREASIVDIPNCRGALAIRNSSGKKIALSGNEQNEEVINYLTSLIPQNTNMDKKLMAIKLGLSESATDQEISTKLAAVLAEANKVPGLNDEVTRLKGEVTNLQNQVNTSNEAAQTAKVEALVDGAVSAKKLAAGDREKYIKLAKADYDTTKELIDAMKPYETMESKLGAGGSGNETDNIELQELTKLSGRELYMQGKLERLKKLSMPHFKVKYKEYWGKDYTGQ